MDVESNLQDYDEARASFSWDSVRDELIAGLPDGRGLNIAYEAVTRHVVGPLRDAAALVWRGRGGERVVMTWAELEAQTNRFANLLAELGIQPGERVFGLCPRVPELYVAALGTLKHRAVFCPLFSAFGPEPIRERVRRGDGRVLVTTDALYRRKVLPVRAELDTLDEVLVIARPGREVPGGTLDLRARLATASDTYRVGPTDPEDMALVHFTSGTTGRPKGAVHVHQAVLMHAMTGSLALDLRAGDVFWCTADPGWVTGTSYGIVAPLVLGATIVVDEGEFDAERWISILESERVDVWYTAPTAVRMLMRLATEALEGVDLSALRLVASVGEPLAPEAVRWGERALGRPIHDNWWQSETGGILIANFRSMPIKPGSMGRPLPGIEAAIVRRTDAGVELVEVPGEQGELAIRAGWPSMFRAYLHEPERYASCFRQGYYLTGDLATRDEDGYFWFVGRADDVIKSAGHLIGPFEVESALMEHPAVAEAAVIGIPDEIAGEVVKAFVLLKAGNAPGEALAQEIHGFARRRLGPAVAPRTVAFVDDLPRTRSGKIMRRLLRARELGLPEGDLSTLEGPPS